MSIRRKSRELALQALYQSEFTGRPATDWFALFCDHFEVSRKAVPYGRDLVTGVTTHLDEIDRVIQGHAEHWRVGRMSLIDRNILRLATFELWFIHDMPASVVINEALEIAKRFSTDEAAPFINGILDAIKKSVLANRESVKEL
jgi:transcription antitermination protein NusB